MSSPFTQPLMKGCCLTLLSILVLTTILTVSAQNEKKTEEAEKKKFNLTGNPQIDYIHDPNLPRELGNYDLSSYPFYNKLPEDVDNFTCDGRYDGFYASIPHECQVYHNCLFGIRYSFLCANFTKFDQVNLNCHYANKVKCESSHLLYDNNANLYIEATTKRTGPKKKRKRRPFRKRITTTPAPAEDEYYYYEYEEEDPPPVEVEDKKQKVEPDYYYYEDEIEPPKPPPPPRAPIRRRPLKKKPPTRPVRIKVPPSQQVDTTLVELEIPSQRVVEEPSQIRRPLPNRVRRPEAGAPKRRRRPVKRRKRPTTTTTTTTTTTAAPEEYEYYDYYDEDYYYYEDETTTTTTTTTAPPPAVLRRRPGKLRRRPIGKRVGRVPERKRKEITPVDEVEIIEEVPIEEERQTLGRIQQPILREAQFGSRSPQQSKLALQGSSLRVTKTLQPEPEIPKGNPVRPGVFRRPLRRERASTLVSRRKDV